MHFFFTIDMFVTVVIIVKNLDTFLCYLCYLKINPILKSDFDPSGLISIGVICKNLGKVEKSLK